MPDNHGLILRVFNSKVEIVTDDEGLRKKAKKLLNIYWSDPRDKTKLMSVYLGRGNFFPIGFLDEFQKKAKKKNIEFSIESHIVSTARRHNFVFKSPVEPMDHQRAALEACKLHSTGIISSPTASGKSLMMGLITAEKSTTTLILTPSESIREGLAIQFREWFGSKTVSTTVPTKPYVPQRRSEGFEGNDNLEPDPDPFAFIFKAKPVTLNKFEKFKIQREKSILKKLESGKWFKPITILCWQSLRQLPKEYVKAVGCILIDECHTASAKDIRDLLFEADAAEFRYGLSATPWRDQPHLLKLMQSAIGSSIIFDYKPEDAIEDEIIAKPNLNIIQADFPTKFMKNVKDYRSIIDYGVIRNIARNRQIVKKAIELYDDNHQVFVAIDEIGHFQGKENESGIIEDNDYCLKRLFEESGQKVIFISGNDSTAEKNRKISELKESSVGFILVGTMAVGIGTDIPGIDKVIFASTGKSSIRFIQRIGRGMRTDGDNSKVLEVFDFMDRWNPYAKKYSIERIKTFSKYFKGCKVYGF